MVALPVERSHPDPGLIFENLAATAALPGGPVTFFAMHPTPPAPWDGTRADPVFAATRAFLDAAPGPAIAAGDFNATRDNVPLRELESDGWIDAATSAGAGLVRTWPNDLPPLPPLVALDHVLTRDTAAARALVTVDIPGTDHRAVIAWL